MFDNQKKQYLKRASCAHASDKGHKRDHNEDNYIADSKIGLFIIADGMGGYEGGAYASSITVRSVRRDVLRGLSLDEALKRAHRNLLEAAGNGMGKPGMGAAAVALKMDGTEYYVAWVGDSRAYLWDGRLKRLTHDHSFVQDLLDKGIITEKEARVHPHRNVLTQALGAVDLPEVQVGTVRGRLWNEQKILLCSDGLTGELDDQEIAAIIRQNLTDAAGVATLIEAANANEGRDNITVILVSSLSRMSEGIDEEATQPIEIKNSNFRGLFWGAALLMLITFVVCAITLL